MIFRVGVVGSCPPTKFDIPAAERAIKLAYDTIAREYGGHRIVIVSGLTNVGVPALAYAEAVKRGWRTVGVACRLACQHPLFDVDQTIIVGDNWGDESKTFVSSIDAIIRVGGGAQSRAKVAEIRRIGKPVYEYDIPIYS